MMCVIEIALLSIVKSDDSVDSFTYNKALHSHCYHSSFVLLSTYYSSLSSSLNVNRNA